MKTVVCFGEALIDFLNTGTHQDGPLSLNDYRQYPGGAPANAAVAVAKLGGKAFFAGQVGADAFGDFLEHALVEYGVNTQYLARHPSAKTALAFVTLDKDGDRSFAFYRQDSADVLFTPQQVDGHWFDQQPIFHFCSNTLTDDVISQTTLAAVEKAKHHQSLVSFDVNLRHNLWAIGHADIDTVNRLVFKADLIKFSRDELVYLAGDSIDDYISQCFSHGVSLVVITDGEHDIEYHTPQGKGSFSVPKVKAVDTTAGGDSFSGSLLFALSHFSQPKEILNSPQQLVALILFASHCGAHTVTKPGAFPALPSFDDIKQYWPEQLATPQ